MGSLYIHLYIVKPWARILHPVPRSCRLMDRLRLARQVLYETVRYCIIYSEQAASAAAWRRWLCHLWTLSNHYFHWLHHNSRGNCAAVNDQGVSKSTLDTIYLTSCNTNLFFLLGLRKHMLLQMIGVGCLVNEMAILSPLTVICRGLKRIHRDSHQISNEDTANLFWTRRVVWTIRAFRFLINFARTVRSLVVLLCFPSVSFFSMHSSKLILLK